MDIFVKKDGAEACVAPYQGTSMVNTPAATIINGIFAANSVRKFHR